MSAIPELMVRSTYDAARFADPVAGFRDAMVNAGLKPPAEIIPDGEIHRFGTNGKSSDSAGWYVLHADGLPAGIFGCWRAGRSQKWCAKPDGQLTPSERADHRARIEAMQQRRDADEAQRKAAARKKAAKIWQAATPAPADHPYLIAKGIQAHGLRIHEGVLIVPMHDGAGELHSVQRIYPTGDKRFLTGGRVTGCCFTIGQPADVLYIAEGFATAATIHEATGAAVAVAFNAGNLLPVAQAMRAKFPHLRLAICADDDAGTPDNPGQTKAREAAEAVNAALAVPDFGANRPVNASDFNDLAQHAGLDGVRRCIDAAVQRPDAGPLLKLVDVANVIRNPSPPPRFVWQGYLPRNEVTLFGAHGGTGKSTLALQLAVATSAGRPLFDIPVEQAAAMVVSLEDGAAIVRHRLARICRLWSIDTDELNGNLTIVDGTEHPELFTAENRSTGRTTPAYAELSALALTLGAGLIVVDNASDAFAGDEIQRLQVRQFVKSLALVARATDAAVLLLAHVSKVTSRAGSDAEAYSGSTAWHNSCRSRLFLSRTGELLTLDHQKSNHGKLRDKLSLVWPEDGLPELAGAESGAIAEAQPLLDKVDTRALLALIAEFSERGEHVSPISTARTNARSLLSAEPSYPKRRSSEIFALLRHAERDGYIERTTYRSTDRKTRDCWAVTATGREWAGLSAPSAPSAPCTDEAAQPAGQKGAPSAPSSAGGMGDSAHTCPNVPMSQCPTQDVPLADPDTLARGDCPTTALPLTDHVIAAYHSAAESGLGTLDPSGTFVGLRLKPWRECFCAMHAGDSPESTRKAFQRARAKMQKAGLLVIADGIYRITEPSTTSREGEFAAAARAEVQQ